MELSRLKEYASLLALKGINVQKGEEVWINCQTAQMEFVRLVVEELYKAGAKKVRVRISDDEISSIISDNFDLRPAAIINNFDLRNLPAKNGGKFYQKLAAYGHVGRTDIIVPWEQLDKVDTIKKSLSSSYAMC